MNYLVLRERPTQFLALTSLHVAEFDDLLRHFNPVGNATTATILWTASCAIFQPIGNGQTPYCQAPTRSFLTYLKTNSLQQHQAAGFGVSQTRVSRLTAPLLDVLNQTLAARDLLLGPLAISVAFCTASCALMVKFLKSAMRSL